MQQEGREVKNLLVESMMINNENNNTNTNLKPYNPLSILGIIYSVSTTPMKSAGESNVTNLQNDSRQLRGYPHLSGRQNHWSAMRYALNCRQQHMLLEMPVSYYWQFPKDTLSRGIKNCCC